MLSHVILNYVSTLFPSLPHKEHTRTLKMTCLFDTGGALIKGYYSAQKDETAVSFRSEGSGALWEKLFGVQSYSQTRGQG